MGYDVDRCREEYKRYCKLTKVAAEKARNAWWTARAVMAERRAWAAEQHCHGGSLIKELKLLKNRFSNRHLLPSQPWMGQHLHQSLPSLRDGALCQCCQLMVVTVDVSDATLESLPVVHPSYQFPTDMVEEEDLCAPLSEEEISDAIFQLRNGRASGLDGITAEMLKLGGAESVR